MKEALALKLYDLIYEISQSSTNLILLVFLIVTFVIVIDGLYEHTQQKKKLTGLHHKSVPLGIDGMKNFPARTYVSDIQLLAGRPDALVREGGFIIPVERKPLAKKIRDRYVAQLLVYMRLIEEFEGAKPPYGYLILGANCKRIKIYNTPEKQAWLQKMLDEMQSILNGGSATASPENKKCRNCSVKTFCKHSLAALPAKHAAQTKLKILH